MPNFFIKETSLFGDETNACACPQNNVQCSGCTNDCGHTTASSANVSAYQKQYQSVLNTQNGSTSTTSEGDIFD